MSKLLLVEDEAIIRDAFSIILSSTGHELDIAINGSEALELCEKQVYDLILLDLMMPVLDGVEFLRQADLRRAAPDTRVVVLSNLSSGDSVAEAVELGAHRHEIKANLAPTELIKLVEEELALRAAGGK